MVKVLESKVSPEGRVSIPVAVRRQLGVQPGDSVRFLLGEDGQYRLATSRSVAEALWARNTGPDAGDAGETVRAMREAEDRRVRHTEPSDWAGARTDDADVLALLSTDS